jgi:hypothetical protein
MTVMAKKPAKSSSEGSKTPATKAKAAPKTAAKVPVKAPQQQAGGMPLIDTNMAANAAAAFVGRKLNVGAPLPKREESAGFKQMKEGLNKPHSQGLSNILETTNQNKKPGNMPNTHGGKQVAHHQTHSADVTRSGVPRRTPG